MKTRIPHLADLRKWAIFLMVVSLLGLVLFLILCFSFYSSWELLINSLEKVEDMRTFYTELGPLVLVNASLFSVLFLGLFISKSYSWSLGKADAIALDAGFTSDTSVLHLSPFWWVLYTIQSLAFMLFSVQFFNLPNPNAQTMGTVIALFSLSGLFGLGSVAFMFALARSKSVRFF
jgi:hypothetical protein